MAKFRTPLLFFSACNCKLGIAVSFSVFCFLLFFFSYQWYHPILPQNPKHFDKGMHFLLCKATIHKVFLCFHTKFLVSPVVKLSSTWTDRTRQTVQTKIRLSDQVLHYFSFHLYILKALLHCKIQLFHFFEQLHGN